MWGERVCPGPSGTGCFDLHLGRVGVSAVMVHQGHARSASHWQARSTDLKLSQTPPRSRQMWRAVPSLCASGLALVSPGTAGLHSAVGRSSDSDTRQR